MGIDKIDDDKNISIIQGRIRKLENTAPTLGSSERDNIINQRKKEAGNLREILKNWGRANNKK